MESFLLDEASWSSGLAPNDYFSGLGNYRNLVLSLYREAVVADEERARVAAALGALTSEGQGVGTTRTTRDAVSSTGKPSEEQPPDRLRLLVLTEDWCGDSATTLPYIARLAEALDLPIRVFRQSANPAIKAWYVERGTEHIPVVSLLRRSSADGDASAPGAAGGWQEVMRWVERPAAAHIRVEAWLASNRASPSSWPERTKTPQLQESTSASTRAFCARWPGGIAVACGARSPSSLP
jgi:hypothetical protein